MIVSLIAFVLAGSAAASDSPGASDGPADPNRVICKSVKQTGSRLGRSRVCLTAAQWEERREVDQKAARDMQNQALNPCATGRC